MREDTVPTTAENPRRGRAPWHLWVVGLFMLALYIGGARDYVLTLTLNPDYMAAQGYAEPQIGYFTDYPFGLGVLWTLNVTGGLASATASILRSRWAVPLALMTALAQLVLLILTFAFRDRWDILGPSMSLFDIGVGVLSFLFWWYCRVMLSRAVLR
ncbi:hypothetical protein GCM10010156_21230 [Planobispora rosea]|uniref:Uncharacterized protein n=1 Tax=Planobispora rosea TaxID=35762 RepID=A0A8J3WBZ0_PLARO|nr:hypothetical protein [Planobispora rosea]GGS62176.1 hypothetical protein GCM10010156_21230 [Planobispora rosea]GIH84364.1 hypothetical protein Pro02_27720 [Planobispora rosea]